MKSTHQVLSYLEDNLVGDFVRTRERKAYVLLHFKDTGLAVNTEKTVYVRRNKLKL